MTHARQRGLVGRIMAMAVLVLSVAALSCMGFTRPALAEEAPTLRVNSSSEHSYTAYCLLSGTADGNSLVNPSFDGAMSGAFYQGLTAMPEWRDASQSASDPRIVRNWIGEQVAEDSDFSFATRLRGLAEQSGSTGVSLNANEDVPLHQGYWLIVGDGTVPVCALVGPGANTVNEKPSVPSSSKEVAKRQGDGSIGDYSDSVTAGVGDTLHYRITGTLPVSYGSYDTYLYRFADTMDASIVVRTESIRVRVLKADGTEKADLTDRFTISSQGTPEGGVSLVVSIDNLKGVYPGYVQGDSVVLEYDATLDTSKATMGYGSPNKNTAHIEYTRDPSAEGVGKTEDHGTHVYSFELRVRKTSSRDADQVLAGAEFVVQRSDGKYLTAGDTWSDSQDAARCFVTDEDGMISVRALDLGDYKLIETKAPGGYQTLGAPVDVSLSGDSARKSLAVLAASQAAVAEDVSASAGYAVVQIKNTPTGETPPGGPTWPPMPEGVSGLLPQTGDLPHLFAAATLLIAGVFAVGMGVRARRHARAETPEHAGSSTEAASSGKRA